MLAGRLKALASLADPEATSIWDIGCDHGLLGTSFIHSATVRKIHLVDPSPGVIEALKTKYNASYITHGKSLFILHEQGQNSKLDLDPKNIFIAGMGGKEIESIIAHLIPQLSERDRLIISPHRRINELRQTLSSGDLFLLDEKVIKDEGQFYQIFSLSLKPSGPKVHPFGIGVFQGEWGGQYLQQQLKTFSSHQDPLSQAYVGYLRSLIN